MTDYDSPWKDVLERYFAALTAFFFPTAHAAIDWARGYAFLDKELQQIARDARLGRRYADKRRTSPNGCSPNYTRIRDRYQRPVVSLAVLTDGRRCWRPAAY